MDIYGLVKRGVEGRCSATDKIWVRTVLEPRVSRYAGSIYIRKWIDAVKNGVPVVPGRSTTYLANEIRVLISDSTHVKIDGSIATDVKLKKKSQYPDIYPLFGDVMQSPYNIAEVRADLKNEESDKPEVYQDHMPTDMDSWADALHRACVSDPHGYVHSVMNLENCRRLIVTEGTYKNGRVHPRIANEYGFCGPFQIGYEAWQFSRRHVKGALNLPNKWSIIRATRQGLRGGPADINVAPRLSALTLAANYRTVWRNFPGLVPTFELLYLAYNQGGGGASEQLRHALRHGSARKLFSIGHNSIGRAKFGKSIVASITQLRA